MKIHDVELLEMTTKKVGRNSTVDVRKLNYVQQEFVETPRGLTYKPTGEKYNVMKVVGGYFENEVVNQYEEKNVSFMSDDVLDKAFSKLASQS